VKSIIRIRQTVSNVLTFVLHHRDIDLSMKNSVINSYALDQIGYSEQKLKQHYLTQL